MSERRKMGAGGEWKWVSEVVDEDWMGSSSRASRRGTNGETEKNVFRESEETFGMSFGIRQVKKGGNFNVFLFSELSILIPSTNSGRWDPQPLLYTKIMRNFLSFSAFSFKNLLFFPRCCLDFSFSRPLYTLLFCFCYWFDGALC